MRYLYDLINKQTKEIEHHGLTCAQASVITGVPLAQIQWYAKQARDCEKYTIIPIPKHKERAPEKADTSWWTDQDTLRWNDIITAAELLRNGGQIVGEGKGKYVVLT